MFLDHLFKIQGPGPRPRSLDSWLEDPPVREPTPEEPFTGLVRVQVTLWGLDLVLAS